MRKTMVKVKRAEGAESLIEAMPFIQKYRGHLFVIKYGGSAMDDDQVVGRMLRDIVFLEAVGINPVVIHGGGKAITDRMRDEGLRAQFVKGLRVTDEKAIGLVEEVLDTRINPKIVRAIEEYGGRASGLSGTKVFRGKKLAPVHDGKEEVDLGFVGEVTGTETADIERIVGDEAVPVISPLAAGEDGRTLNVNADLAAGSIAGALKASKLIYLSDVPGIMRDPKEADSLIPSVNRSVIARLIQEEVIEGGMIPKVTSAVDALDRGVGKVHFIDGRVPHALLLEIFTNDGIGTEILP
jgi:acetylglutamate kinase